MCLSFRTSGWSPGASSSMVAYRRILPGTVWIIRAPEMRSTRSDASLLVVSGTPWTRMIRLLVRTICSACQVWTRRNPTSAMNRPNSQAIGLGCTIAARRKTPSAMVSTRCGGRQRTIQWCRVVARTGSSEGSSAGTARSGGELVEEGADPLRHVGHEVPAALGDACGLVGRGHHVEDEERADGGGEGNLDHRRGPPRRLVGGARRGPPQSSLPPFGARDREPRRGQPRRIHARSSAV